VPGLAGISDKVYTIHFPLTYRIARTQLMLIPEDNARAKLM
jgi:hypothetical protein